jgi:polyhydroxybutyrate depolymerase
VFAAAASVSGLLAIECAPSRPFPILHFHGTDDFIVSYDGGGFAGNDSVEDVMNGWATRNGCAATRTRYFENGEARCERYDGCPAGAEVEVCTIDDGGHAWPGGGDQPNLYGHMTNDIDATDAIWEFFAAHPLP